MQGFGIAACGMIGGGIGSLIGLLAGGIGAVPGVIIGSAVGGTVPVASGITLKNAIFAAKRYFEE